jgi:hypothetical protein
MTEGIDGLSTESANDAASFAEITGGLPPESTPAIEEKAAPAALSPAPAAEAPSNEPAPIPYARFKEERERTKAYERQIAELLARLPQPEPPKPQPKPDLFENPDQYMDYRIQPELQRRDQAALFNAKMIAEARYGEDKVLAAQQAFDDLLDSGTHVTRHQQ